MRNVLLNLLFPRRCAICRRELDTKDVCDECVAAIPIFRWISCIRCGRRLGDDAPCPLHRDQTPIRGIGAATDYNRPDVRRMLHTYKYRGRKALAEPLAELLIRHAAGDFAAIIARSQPTIVPIPLTHRRLFKRGFNQSALLAERVASRLNLAYEPSFLERHGERQPQVEIENAQVRRQNIKGVFRVGADQDRIRGRTILLIDDVATSGATLEEAARTLKRAGAKAVWAMVIARGR